MTKKKVDWKDLSDEEKKGFIEKVDSYKKVDGFFSIGSYGGDFTINFYDANNGTVKETAIDGEKLENLIKSLEKDFGRIKYREKHRLDLVDGKFQEPVIAYIHQFILLDAPKN